MRDVGGCVGEAAFDGPARLLPIFTIWVAMVCTFIIVINILRQRVNACGEWEAFCLLPEWRGDRSAALQQHEVFQISTMKTKACVNCDGKTGSQKG